MKIIVVGCGRLGADLAYRLSKDNHDISVIDHVADSFYNLPPDFNGLTIEGEALSEDVLIRAGIEKADALAAVTNSDALNAVVAHAAREHYHTRKIVVRNYDPKWREIHEAFGFQVVSSTSWGSQRIEELIKHEIVHPVFSAGNGEVEIYELVVPKNWHERTIKELFCDGNCVTMALTRSGRALIPESDTIMHEGDILHFSATHEGVAEVRTRLKA
jgi:trk system potassium uptake protein TrkA